MAHKRPRSSPHVLFNPSELIYNLDLDRVGYDTIGVQKHWLGVQKHNKPIFQSRVVVYGSDD